jgi:hypothetical protein
LRTLLLAVVLVFGLLVAASQRATAAGGPGFLHFGGRLYRREH